VRLKSTAISAVGFFVFAFVQMVVAAPPVAICQLPKDLQREITTKYPGAKLVSFSDLREDHKTFFQKTHRNACPGLVKVDFYGDRKPTWAMVVIATAESKEETELVVAHQVGKDWQIAVLEMAGATVPVLWRLGPGKYRDVYGEKQIRAKWPVIVFGEYGSWIILYSWTGKTTDKIWLID
jgi:hypothetical protein